MTAPDKLFCEIAADPAAATQLAAIVRTCAVDAGLPVVTRLKHAARTAPSIIFRVPVALVFAHDDPWTLAGRVACFCTHARVAIVIETHASALPCEARATERDAAA